MARRCPGRRSVRLIPLVQTAVIINISREKASPIYAYRLGVLELLKRSSVHCYFQRIPGIRVGDSLDKWEFIDESRWIYFFLLLRQISNIVNSIAKQNAPAIYAMIWFTVIISLMGTPVSRSMTTSTMAHTMNAAIAKLIVSFCNAFINLKFRFMCVKLWFSVNIYNSSPGVSEKEGLDVTGFRL